MLLCVICLKIDGVWLRYIGFICLGISNLKYLCEYWESICSIDESNRGIVLGVLSLYKRYLINILYDAFAKAVATTTTKKCNQAGKFHSGSQKSIR